MGEQDQSCAITITVQKEWLGFLFFKHVKKGRRKIASSHQRASLRAVMVCSSGRRLLAEAGHSFSKPKHLAVIYFSGWLWKQDLDRNINGFSAAASLEPVSVPAATSRAGCGQGLLGHPCFLRPHEQPPASPPHHLEAQKAPVQTNKKFLQLFAGLGQPPPSGRKTQLKCLEFSVNNLEYFVLGSLLATS